MIYFVQIFAYNFCMRKSIIRSGEQLNPYLTKINLMLSEFNMTPSYLSAKAGLGTSTLSNLMKRNNVPTISTLDKICAVVGVRLSTFIKDVEEENPEISKSARTGILRHDPLSSIKEHIFLEWEALPAGDRDETLKRMQEIHKSFADTADNSTDGDNEA